MKRIMSILLALLLSPTTHYDSEITLTVAMDSVVFVGAPDDYSIIASNADTVSYAFWFEAPDSTFVKRTKDYVILSNGVQTIKSTFQTCPLVGFVIANPCQAEWVLGNWELRVAAWRWVNGRPYVVSETHSFVVQ